MLYDTTNEIGPNIETSFQSPYQTHAFGLWILVSHINYASWKLES